jgi:hypothetical protein
MTYSSTFMSDLIRGIVASRPQVAEDWLFVQDVASPPGALGIRGDADHDESSGRAHAIRAHRGVKPQSSDHSEALAEYSTRIQSDPTVLNLQVQL